MPRNNSIPKYLIIITMVISLLTLSTAPQARTPAQDKKGAKKTPSKTADKNTSEQETGIVINPDGKSATVKKNFVAEKTASNRALVRNVGVRRVDIGPLEVKCNCSEGRGGCEISVFGNGITCQRTGDCEKCSLVTSPVKQ